MPIPRCLLAVLLLSACDAAEPPATESYVGPPAPLVRVALGGDARVAPCQEVQVAYDLVGEAASVNWSVTGVPALHLNVGTEFVTFRAPVSNVDITVTVSVRATDLNGVETGADTRVTIAAQPDGEGLATGMARGCGPFWLGVASGDPHPDSVLLWTALPDAEEPSTLEWEVATDLLLNDVVASGSATALPEVGGTVTVEADGLQPGTTYYYRFTSGGDASVLGRTRTAAGSDAQAVTLAVGSCSSVWSGYFNPYARLAERDEVDLMVHLGDFVYDFVDAEEEVRLPPGAYPVDPSTPAQWRDRFLYYLSDPDLRRARQAHPWFVIWDNHDSDVGDEEGQGTTVLFREYVPMRRSDANHRIAWRRLTYGRILDLYMLDATVHRQESENPALADILSEPQWRWFQGEFESSEAAWRVIATQKLVSTLVVPPVGFGKPSPWDDYPLSRARFFEILAGRPDNLVLSGDLHFSIAADMVLEPAEYVPEDGVGSVGAELLATGITRGNFDETLCGGLCTESKNNLIADIATQLERTNPHVAGLELIQHGYAVVTVDAEAAEATYYYSPIRELTDVEIEGPSFVAPRGLNRWRRTP